MVEFFNFNKNEVFSRFNYMRFFSKKTLRNLHLWLGMFSGIIVFAIAITGAIYVFSYEIKSMLYKEHEIIEIPENQNRVSLTKLVETASSQFENKYSFQNIVIPNFPDHSITVNFMETDEGAFGYSNYVKFHKTVYLNPYTGKVIHVENSKWEFFNIILAIHMNLFMGYNSVSHFLIVTSIWVFVIMLLTGLVLWWPKKKQRKTNFWFRWKKTSKWKRKNYDLHRILGFYSFAIALVMALTGLMWASKSFNASVKWIANGGKTVIREEIPKTKEIDIVKYPLENILDTTLTNIPESKYILIRKHPKPSIPYIVRAYTSEHLNYNRIEMFYDKKTAELLSKKTFDEKNNGEKIQALNYDIHVGSIGGLPTKILALLVSLIIASLPVSGFLIWYGRNKK